MIRLLWREFCDMDPDSPAPDVSQIKMAAVIAVLLLRVMLWWLVMTPFVPVMVVQWWTNV